MIIQVPHCCFEMLLPPVVPGMAYKFCVCGCIQRRLFFKLRHFPSENAMLRLSLCGCIQRMLMSNVDTLSATRSTHPPRFQKVLQKYHSRAGKSLKLF